jgi:hypothetical protein
MLTPQRAQARIEHFTRGRVTNPGFDAFLASAMIQL